MPVTDGVVKSIVSIVEEVCVAHADRNAACEIVRAKLQDGQFSDALIEMGIGALVDNARHRLRSQCTASAIEMVQRPSRRTLANELDANRERVLLNDWIVGSKALGECKSEDLAEARDREVAMSDGHRRNARFYASIIGKLPEGRTVREALTNEQVALMLAKANE